MEVIGDCYMYYDLDELEGRLCIKLRSDLWFCYDVYLNIIFFIGNFIFVDFYIKDSEI